MMAFLIREQPTSKLPVRGVSPPTRPPTRPLAHSLDTNWTGHLFRFFLFPQILFLLLSRLISTTFQVFLIASPPTPHPHPHHFSSQHIVAYLLALIPPLFIIRVSKPQHQHQHQLCSSTFYRSQIIHKIFHILRLTSLAQCRLPKSTATRQGLHS